MNLESLKIMNFRKFDDTTEGNTINFSSKHDCDSEDRINGFTLLVGKNNSGKTTIASALDFLFSDKEKIDLDDINKVSIYTYLQKLIDSDFEDDKEVYFPIVTFVVNIKIDNDSASLNNFYDIIPFDFDVKSNGSIKLEVTYKIQDELEMKSAIKKIIEEAKTRITRKNPEQDTFDNKYYITTNSFWKAFENHYSNINMVREVKFNDLIKKIPLSNKFKIHIVRANKKLDASENETLKSSLAKIIKKQNEEANGQSLEQKMIDHTQDLNEELEKQHGKEITNRFNDFAKSLRSNEKLEVDIYFDIFKEGFSSSAINYVYKENGHGIRNDKFGLGYTNLFHIISEIIKFIEDIKTKSQNKINLLFIEEPEAFMHPQLQVKFITYIREALNTIVKDNQQLFLQTIISTHSSNIVKSKIESSNSFEYINVLHADKRGFSIGVLGDKFITGERIGKPNEEDEKKKILRYITQKVCLEMANSFFADLIVLVEGDTENLLVNHCISKDESFEGKYVQLFNVGGRHMTEFYNFYKKVGIPTLIITDLDFNDSSFDEENNYSKQVTLKDIIDISEDKKPNEIITNSFVYNVMAKDRLIDFIKENECFVDENIVAVTQNIVAFEKRNETIIPTSFEESLLCDGAIVSRGKQLIDIFKEIHPQKYKGLDFKKETRVIQKKLTKKVELANSILFSDINNEMTFELPFYIKKGLTTCSKFYFSSKENKDEC